MRATVSLLKGEPVPKRQVLVPKMITRATYTDFIRPNLPDGVFTDTSLRDDQLAAIFNT